MLFGGGEWEDVWEESGLGCVRVWGSILGAFEVVEWVVGVDSVFLGSVRPDSVVLHNIFFSFSFSLLCFVFALALASRMDRI